MGGRRWEEKEGLNEKTSTSVTVGTTVFIGNFNHGSLSILKQKYSQIIGTFLLCKYKMSKNLNCNALFDLLLFDEINNCFMKCV